MSDQPVSSVVVILAGAGCVEGAWPPVIDALRESVSPELTDEPDLANLELARLVHLLRFHHDRDPNTEHHLRAELAKLRRTIADHLIRATASGQLVARPAFIDLVRSLTPRFAEVSAITTNWDRTVTCALQLLTPEVKTLHLHGSVEDDSTLYLPSEISVEVYRPAHETRMHAQTLRATIELIGRATDLVIYGLSFSPLDAELCQALWVGRDGRAPLRSVRVIDINADPVAKRVALILGARRLPASGILTMRPGDAI